MRRKLLVAATVLCFTAGVQGATLSNLEGLVFVDKGSGFQPATAGDTVSPGDRVRVSQGAVNVVYSNGYAMQVGQNETAVVLATPPDPAASGGGEGGSSSWAPSSSTLWIAGGIVAVGAGVTAAVLANNNSNNNNDNKNTGATDPVSSQPASP